MVSMQVPAPLLTVEHLKKYFPVGRSFFGSKTAVVRAVDDISFNVNQGQALGLVGESGCGKTTAGRAILRLTEPTEGRVHFDSVDVTAATSSTLTQLRRRMQFMFQDPYSSLDPRMSVYRILKEPLDNFFHGLSRREKQHRVTEVLEHVGLEAVHMTRFPHEFSGGQRQRIALARALICSPELIICDEPVSALDVSIQAQVINLLDGLRKDLELSLIFISHDLAVVQHLCEVIAVMYLGRIVEISPRGTLYKNPRHPYTRSLLSAVPIPDPVLERSRKSSVLMGDVPSPINVPTGCYFHPRCTLAEDVCRSLTPALTEVSLGHFVACHREISRETEE